MRPAVHLGVSIALLLLVCSAWTGCSSQSSTDSTPMVVSGSPPPIGADHNHDGHHAHHGPHGGQIIELGRNHEYHAEIVEDHASQRITIYVLDESMNLAPIRSPQITIHLTVDGSASSFALLAAEPVNGRSARFDAVDSSLFQALHQHLDMNGKLRVTIEGIPYVGRIAHHSHVDHR